MPSEFQGRRSVHLIVAVALPVAALVVRLALIPLMGHSAPYFIFFIAAAVSAALGGFRTGAVTTLVGLLCAGPIMPPGGWMHLTDPTDSTALIRFLISGLVVAWLCGNLFTSRERALQAEAAMVEQARELKRSNRALEQFAFAASHDLQEPLRVVNIYTELLLSRMTGEQTAEMSMFAGYIHDGVSRMERLIADLLSMSRVIHTEITRQATPADSALDSALDSLSALIKEAQPAIQRQPLPVVLAEATHLSQVFQNLISNAIKYRKPDQPAVIGITASKSGADAVFMVEDNGIGFDQAYAESIFGIFKRLHGRQYPGTGIGLAICQSILERHGGRIWAESKPGEGARFFFTLPLADSSQARKSLVK